MGRFSVSEVQNKDERFTSFIVTKVSLLVCVILTRVRLTALEALFRPRNKLFVCTF